MNVLSRTLERVTETLLGRRTPGRHARPAVTSAPHVPLTRPAPGMLGARLGVVRRRCEEGHAGPVPTLPGALVQPYVGHLGATPGNANSVAQTVAWAGPWGDDQ